MGWFKKCKCAEKPKDVTPDIAELYHSRIQTLEQQVRELQSCIPTTYEVEPWTPKFFIQRNKAGRKSRTIATFDSHEEATEALKFAEKFEYVDKLLDNAFKLSQMMQSAPYSSYGWLGDAQAKGLLK